VTERYLFRGKWIDNYKKDEWEYGCFCLSRNYKGNKLEMPTIQDAIDPATVGQCTGLRDKNETLIYEGDIVAFGGENYTIVYGDACFWISQEEYAIELHTTIGQGDIEIIGNIHDNPELLGAALYNNYEESL
jgi:uncharacterized phage protein (TIGR01671 family)